MNAIFKSALYVVFFAISISAHAQQTRLNPTVNWADSYSRGGVCWIDSTFDHAVGRIGVRTNEGLKTVRDISAAQDRIRLARRGSDPIYNDVQCGHGPANNNGDEDQDQCPGRVDQGSSGCKIKGPTWNLDALFPGEKTAPKPPTETEPATTTTSIPAAETKPTITPKPSVAPAPEQGSIPMAKALPAAACFTTGRTARADFEAKCGNVARDCDPIIMDGYRIQMCANFQLGFSAPTGVPTKDEISSAEVKPKPDPKPQTPIVISNISSETSTPVVSTPLVSTEPSEVINAVCTAKGSNLVAARQAYANSCPNIPRRDCDPIGNKQWICSSAVVGDASPSNSGVATATQRSTIESTHATTIDSIGRVGANDLVALHYDNCPDRDDGHALAAGKAVVVKSGLHNVLIVNGTCGDDIRSSYQRGSEQVAHVLWGNQWLDSFNNLEASIQTSTERWVSVLANGGHVWVAEGGPSDFTAKVLRSIISQFPTLNLKNVHVVQHSTGSGFNEANTTKSNIDLVKAKANYIAIPNGNSGGNGSAGLNNKSSFFVEVARQSEFSNEWGAAFNYMDPNRRLDFSDTVELLYMIDDTVTQTVDDFARKYLR